MDAELSPTKILIVDGDDAAFEIRQCIAQTLKQLPPVELFHARDATEALNMLERLEPDVIVLDDAEFGECELFIDSLSGSHPPIVLCTEQNRSNQPKAAPAEHQEITYLPKSETLEEFHTALVTAATIGSRSHSTRSGKALH